VQIQTQLKKSTLKTQLKRKYVQLNEYLNIFEVSCFIKTVIMTNASNMPSFMVFCLL
jgi:hypothetical protein